MNFVAATHNEKKKEELVRILKPLGIGVETAELPPVDETGKTFAENAYLKAQSACRATGKPAVADDSGLSVDALGGAPGVYSARYAGEGATDAQRIEKLLNEMKDVPAGKRAARFVSAICCVFPGGRVVAVEGRCEGTVAFAPRGDDGFGYDPVFLVNGKSYAQMTPSEKDAVSHRGRALEKLVCELEKLSRSGYNNKETGK